MLQESIGLSVILGFLASEFLGLSAGGLVSPGYLAFFVDQPLRIVATLLFSVLIAAAVRLAQRFLVIYGRRRFMAAMLLSLAGTWLADGFLFATIAVGQDTRLIGYIIPGLIANDMLKQGVAKTMVVTVLCALLVRLALMAVAAL